MDYFKTRPPVTAVVIEDLIARLESMKTRTIDGVVLSNLVRVCYECALKKNQLIKLSVKDVAKGGVVGNIMQIDGSGVSVSQHAKQVIQDHINYLKKNGYRMYPTYPLFPEKDKKRYKPKNLDNHLKKAQSVEIESSSVQSAKPLKEDNEFADTPIGLEQIRQAGVCRYYDNLNKKVLSLEECIEKTRIFARIKKSDRRHVKDLLAGQIQPTGKKTSTFSKYLEEIEMVEFELTITESSIKRRTYPEIRRAIEKDPKLNDEEKQALESEIDFRIQEA